MRITKTPLLCLALLVTASIQAYADPEETSWEEAPKQVQIRNYNHGPSPITEANWAGGLDIGLQRPTMNSQMTIQNNSGFPTPYDTDIYLTQKINQGFIGLSVSRLWQRRAAFFPAASLGFRYRYMLPMNVGNQVLTQYSSTLYENYDYTWKVSSNVLTAQGKLDLMQFNLTPISTIMPYISAGFGVTANQAASYSETAKPEITPRTSPAYAPKSNNNFTYNVGAGLDLKATSHLIFSLGYEYQNLGSISSGFGASSWSEMALNLGTLSTSAVLLGFSYLFDN